MRILLSCITLVYLTITTSFAQAKDFDIIKTENGRTTTYFAKSNIKETLIIEFSAEGVDYTTSVSLPVKVEVKPLSKQELASITMGENASYKVSYKYTKGGNAGSTMAASPGGVPERAELLKGIVVFSKDGCSKCDYAKKYLSDKGKTYTTLNISKNENDQHYMWKKLADAGFSGGSVQTPVIMVDGKVHFNMDLKLLLADIK